MASESGNVEVASKALDGYLDTVSRVQANAESAVLSQEKLLTGVQQIEEAYKSLGSALTNVIALLKEYGKASSEAAEKKTDGEGKGIWGFLETDKNDFDEEKKKFKERIGLTKELEEQTKATFSAINGYEELHKTSLLSRTAVETKAYQAMGDQLLKLVETHKFSVGEFAKAMAEQVKTELVGLAAKASIWAIFETAMGLKDTALGLPTAALHFAAAQEFGVIAGASLAAATGVQSLLGGETEESESSSTNSTSSSSSSTSSSVSTSSTSSSEKSTQQVTVNIYNPLSEQNWQKIVEDSIVPALNNAAEKNITVTVKS